MSLTSEERSTLVELQIEKASKNLSQADDVLKLEYYDLAANRYYYACFHALQALLINSGHFCHTHSGLIAEFGKHFIKTGILDQEYGRFVTRLEQLREKGDYNCLYELSKEEVEELKPSTHDLIDQIISLLKKQNQF